MNMSGPLNMSGPFPCPYCPKLCQSEGGLKQHISRTNKCREAQMRQAGARISSTQGTGFGSHSTQNYGTDFGATRRSTRNRKRAATAMNPIPNASNPCGIEQTNRDGNATNPPDDAYDMVANDAYIAAGLHDASGDGSIDFGLDMDEEDGSTESAAEDVSIAERPPPNTKMLAAFRQYCKTHPHKFLPLTKAQKTSIRLLATLKR